MTVIDLCLKQNYFSYQNKYYKLNSGLPMGSPLSPLFAEIYMDHLEKNIVTDKKKISNYIKPWSRYVDDIFCIWTGTQRQLNQFLNFYK